MGTLVKYRETFGDEYPPISSMISDVPISQKSIVLEHLKCSEHIEAASPAILTDFITGIHEKCGEYFSYRLYGDGVYAWTTSDVYHFEKYNLKLPDDFIEYVLNKVI